MAIEMRKMAEERARVEEEQRKQEEIELAILKRRKMLPKTKLSILPTNLTDESSSPYKSQNSPMKR